MNEINLAHPIVHRDEYDVVLTSRQQALRVIERSFITNEKSATVNVH